MLPSIKIIIRTTISLHYQIKNKKQRIFTTSYRCKKIFSNIPIPMTINNVNKLIIKSNSDNGYSHDTNFR